MNDRWSLDELYPSIDSEAFQKDTEEFKAYINNLNAFADQNFGSTDNAAEKIGAYVDMINGVSKYENLFVFANLILSVDVMDERASKTTDVLQEIFTGLTRPEVLFKQFLVKINGLCEILESSPKLREHRFILLEMKDEAQHMLSEPEEILAAKLQITGSSAWEKLRDQLSATLMVEMEINGEKRSEPLTVVRNYAYDADDKLRRTAYEAELNAYVKIDKSIAACLNGVKGEVLTVSKMRGYETPLDMTLLTSRMDRAVLDAMFSAIDKYLPAFRKYLRHKAKLLGHSGALPFYDLFAPVGKTEMNFSYGEACAYTVKNFRDFSDKLADYAQTAIDGRWIDVYPREGKQGGAFCAGAHYLKQSRIMLNFKGAFQDVCTLAHELGHGYHNECQKDETLLNNNSPMPLAETASTFCETIIINSALKNANRDESLAILDNDLTGAAQVIVDIYSRFLFEDAVFARRAGGGLSVNELNEIMAGAQKKAYGDGLDAEYLHPYMWACKSHYYYASRNYYNFPYAYGHLFSKGLYAKYLAGEQTRADGENPFLAEYDQLLASTGKYNLKDIAHIAGIDVTNTKFWEKSLALIEDDIEKYINL